MQKLLQEPCPIMRNRFPPGWNAERVRRVLEHYERQTEEEAVAEDEAAFEGGTGTVFQVPTELVAKVRELIGTGGSPPARC
jgi:hypothetical protein